MNSTTTIRAFVLSASVLALSVGSTFAQQTTGAPGSPSATTTIDGTWLPATKGDFSLYLRAYWPEAAITERK